VDDRQFFSASNMHSKHSRRLLLHIFKGIATVLKGGINLDTSFNWRKSNSACFSAEKFGHHVFPCNYFCGAVCIDFSQNVKVKMRVGVWLLRSEPLTELRSITCHMGSHSVTCHATEVNAPRLKSSQCSIYLPWRDGRL